ncbi:MAG: glycosyltransferase [Candidatus Thorarchaeota archaeon]
METNKKIKICHLISGDLWAGAEIQMYTLVNTLKRFPGINLSAIVLNDKMLATKLAETEVKTSIIDENKYGFFEILKKLKELLINDQIDILHTHRYKENILGAIAKSGCRLKYLIQTVHGTVEHYKGFKKVKMNINLSLDRYFTKKYFDKILTVSNDIRNQYSKYIKDDKLVTVHNFIEPKSITITKSRELIKKELNIDLSCPVIGSAGRITPVKGFEMFLKMAKLILEQYPQTVFLIVGEGPTKNKLEDTAQKIGIAKSVKFVGFKQNIFDYINCFDIFVISSLHEGVPMVALEAMALKKPLVSTNVGGMPEIIENNVSGILVNLGDVSELADACLRIMNNLELKSFIRNNALKRVNDLFSAKAQGQKMLEIYKKGIKIV